MSAPRGFAAVALALVMAAPVALAILSPLPGDADPPTPGRAGGAAAVDAPADAAERIWVHPDASAVIAPWDPHVLVPPPPTPQPLAGPPGAKTMEFVCPGSSTGLPSNVGTVTIVYTCPRRIYDYFPGANQGYLLGNIDLDVNEDDPTQFLFATLHGQSTSAGPTSTSRTQLTHSAYPSPDSGYGFGDEWTGPGNNGGTFGDENAALITPAGDMVVAYTWSDRSDLGFDGTLFVYKGDTLSQSSQSFMEIYGESQYAVRGHQRGAFISEPDLVYYPMPAPPNATGNGTAPGGAGGNGTADNGTAPGEIGQYTVDIPSEGLVVLTYHESLDNSSSPKTGMSGWIDIHWSRAVRANGPSAWSNLTLDQLVGPCRDASNAVVWDERVWVACSVDRGYDERRRARVGDVDLWSFDPRSQSTRFESFTGLNGDHPRLAVTDDGYFAVVTSRVVDEQQVEVGGTVGWYGTQWSQTHQLGPILHRAMGSEPILDAHVTAIDIAKTGRTVLAIYKEWNPVDGDLAPPQPDPTDPTAIAGVELKGTKKVAFSFDECTAPIAGAQFALGDALVEATGDAYQHEALKENPGAFNDRRDGMDIARLPDGREVAWFVVGDYGAAQFAGIVVDSAANDIACPVIPPPPILPPVPPAPLATSLTSPGMYAAGAAIGAVSIAMVAYLLTLRKRAPQSVAAKDE